MIFSEESTFYVLKRKNQCKVYRLEKEKLLTECLQQTNTGDGGKVGIWGGISGFGMTNAYLLRKYEWRVILRCFTERSEVVFSKNSGARKNDISTRFGFMAYIKYCQGKNSQTEVKNT